MVAWESAAIAPSKAAPDQHTGILLLLQAEIDTWLASAFAIETASKAWVEPYASSGAYDDEVSP